MPNKRLHRATILERTPERDALARRAKREQTTPIFVGAKAIPIAIEKPKAKPIDYRPLLALCAILLTILALAPTGLLDDAENYRVSHGGRP